jgi:hypothetical protein
MITPEIYKKEYVNLRVDAPYGIRTLENGKKLVFNRDYKPVGLITSGWVDYSLYGIDFDLTTEAISELSFDANPDPELFWLFNDGVETCIFRGKPQLNRYKKKLEKHISGVALASMIAFNKAIFAATFVPKKKTYLFSNKEVL